MCAQTHCPSRTPSQEERVSTPTMCTYAVIWLEVGKKNRRFVTALCYRRHLSAPNGIVTAVRGLLEGLPTRSRLSVCPRQESFRTSGLPAVAWHGVEWRLKFSQNFDPRQVFFLFYAAYVAKVHFQGGDDRHENNLAPLSRPVGEQHPALGWAEKIVYRDRSKTWGPEAPPSSSVPNRNLVERHYYVCARTVQQIRSVHVRAYINVLTCLRPNLTLQTPFSPLSSYFLESGEIIASSILCSGPSWGATCLTSYGTASGRKMGKIWPRLSSSFLMTWTSTSPGLRASPTIKCEQVHEKALTPTLGPGLDKKE